jgi:hypothetical protein
MDKLLAMPGAENTARHLFGTSFRDKSAKWIWFGSAEFEVESFNPRYAGVKRRLAEQGLDW